MMPNNIGSIPGIPPPMVFRSLKGSQPIIKDNSTLRPRSPISFFSPSWAWPRISVLRTAPSPFRMRKLHISGSLIISIVRLLDDHISRMLVVIFIRMRVLFVTCNLHETVLYPDKIWYVLIKLLHTFAMTHTSYNTSFCK